MQDRYAYDQHRAFLIKCIKDNKIKKVTVKIDKICIFRVITKIHDHFIADQYIYANFTRKAKQIYLFPHN